MSGLRRAWHEVRMLAAELCCHCALALAPKGHDDATALALVLHAYFTQTHEVRHDA